MFLLQKGNEVEIWNAFSLRIRNKKIKVRRTYIRWTFSAYFQCVDSPHEEWLCIYRMAHTVSFSMPLERA